MPISRFLFGEGDGLKLDIAHGLHSIVTDVEPAIDSEFRIGSAGAGRAMVRRWDHTLASVARWIPYAPGTGDSPISGGIGWAEFFEWAREMRSFLFVPDVNFPDFWVPDCYLVEPLRGGGTPNAILTRDVPFKIRTNSGVDFAVALRGLFHHIGPSGRGARFLRNSIAYGLGGNPLRYRAAAIDDLVSAHHAHGEIGALLIGFNPTNLVLKSSDVDPGLSQWTENGSWTVTDALPFIIGGAEIQAHKVVNDNVAGSRNIRQSVGTFDGNVAAIMWIVENIDAVDTEIAIHDSTAPTTVHRAKLTWATGAFVTTAGAGELLAAELLADVGPNGGKVYRLVLNATGSNVGNTRNIYIYPTGLSQNGLGVHLHHAQLIEKETTHEVIVTDTASVQRALDDFSIAWPWNPQAMWVYLKFIDTGAGEFSAASGRLFDIEDFNLSNINPRFALRVGTANRIFGVLYRPDGSTLKLREEPSAGTHGDLVELLAHLRSDGSLVLRYARNDSGEAVTAATSASYMADHWATTRATFARGGETGGGSRQTPLVLLDFKAGPGVAVNTLALARSA